MGSSSTSDLPNRNRAAGRAVSSEKLNGQRSVVAMLGEPVGLICALLTDFCPTDASAIEVGEIDDVEEQKRHQSETPRRMGIAKRMRRTKVAYHGDVVSSSEGGVWRRRRRTLRFRRARIVFAACTESTPRTTVAAVPRAAANNSAAFHARCIRRPSRSPSTRTCSAGRRWRRRGVCVSWTQS